MERNYTTNNLGRNSGKFDSGNQSKSNKSTTSSTQLAQLNTFKITSRNEKSKSPGKKSDKDKIVFIKAQMKNDSANFTGYDIGDEGSKQIAEILLTKTTKVKELKLTKCNITDEGAIQILKAMETNSSVSSLNMSKNNITDKSVDAFVNMFNKNKSLKNILLSNNNLTSVAKDKIKSYSGIQGLKIFI